MTVTVAHTDIADLCAGSVFLATGGGGDPYISQILVQQSLQKFGAVDLLPLSEVPDDAYVVAIGEVGAPTVSWSNCRSAMNAWTSSTVSRRTSAGKSPTWCRSKSAVRIPSFR